ncbi:NAD-dependent protein deacylase [Ilyobacter polytropus]|uniref:NAD-dependent protein deacetylase n=1 Tax=Ilyobacter polytropus (strain ATCC 51220 / DSM 2926 / LMG 16218 / CuHBu1) TaxID=572544 RepID=E3HAW9_ILYPC|nr:NAD-dependent protein deacylase [Ilyobacter polytropus]ADO82120.1 Silent information regulator protein Sir2 [Ilyobacter polytropus DSM 2926]
MYEELKNIIKKSNNIVFFGGAGVSTESNIPDFRSATGLYAHSPEYLLSRTYFDSNTEEFYKFYKENLIFKDAEPNDAHYALAKLEELGKLKAVITQNIDGLHQKAGSKKVYELHGSVIRNYCMKCNEYHDLDYIISFKETVPRCRKCGGLVKPDVTLYEEMLDMDVFGGAIDCISKADVLIVGGTSLVVYPAASLVEYYKGSKLVLINKGATSYDNKASLVIDARIGEVLKEVTREL